MVVSFFYQIKEYVPRWADFATVEVGFGSGWLNIQVLNLLYRWVLMHLLRGWMGLAQQQTNRGGGWIRTPKNHSLRTVPEIFWALLITSSTLVRYTLIVLYVFYTSDDYQIFLIDMDSLCLIRGCPCFWLCYARVEPAALKIWYWRHITDIYISDLFNGESWNLWSVFMIFEWWLYSGLSQCWVTFGAAGWG